MRIEDDLTPSNVFRVPHAATPPHAGRIQINVEYRIDPARSPLNFSR